MRGLTLRNEMPGDQIAFITTRKTLALEGETSLVLIRPTLLMALACHFLAGVEWDVCSSLKKGEA